MNKETLAKNFAAFCHENRVASATLRITMTAPKNADGYDLKLTDVTLTLEYGVLGRSFVRVEDRNLETSEFKTPGSL